MGSSAVPWLVAELESPPSPFGYAMNSLLNRIRKYPLDYNQQHSWRHERACNLLREMGESARDAIPFLEKASTNGMWYIATSARAALVKLRKESLAPYIALLNNRSDPISWYSNAMMIADCGTNAAPAIPLLLTSLQNSNNIIQAHAIIAMGMIRCEPQVCVPAIIPFLTNADVALRQKAYFALLAFKDHTHDASNEVIIGLNDSDPWTRSQALLAVDEILSSAERRRALPHAEALLSDPNPFVRDSAKKLLPRIRAKASK
jgi:HEAT repeat protein